MAIEDPTAPPSRRKGAVNLALRLAPVALLAVALVAALMSGVLDHLSLHGLRRDRFILQAYVLAHPVLSLGAYCLVYVALVSLSLPAPLVMTLAGGFLFGPWVGGIAADLSCTAGGIIVYIVCRFAVGDAIDRRVGPRIRALEEGFRKDAVFYLLTLRLIPVTPFWLANIAAGLIGMSFRGYVVATAIGILPASLIYAGIGSGLGRVFYHGAGGGLHELITARMLTPLIGLALLSVLPLVYQRWRARRLAQA